MKLAVGRRLPLSRCAQGRGRGRASAPTAPASNNSLDLLADLKAFALVQRHAAEDPTVLPAAEAWGVATGASAPRLGRRRRALVVGAPADFLLLRSDAPELCLGSLHSDLVYAAAGSVVDTTVVAGRVLMRGGVVEEGEEIVARTAERARRLMDG